MLKFASAIMLVLAEVFGLQSKYMICKPNEDEGQFLLSEILRFGNFGQHNSISYKQHGPWMRGLENTKRNISFITHYPNEVLWAPLWKIWHWCWRKKNSY